MNLNDIKKMLDAGSYQKAEIALVDYLHNTPESKRGLFIFALLAFKMEKYDLASVRYKEALIVDPGCPWKLMGMADTLRKLNKEEDAKKIILDNRHNFLHLLPYQLKVHNILINNQAWGEIITQAQLLDGEILSNQKIAENIILAMFYTPDLKVLIKSLDCKKIGTIFRQTDAIHPVLFRFWRSAPDEKLRENARLIINIAVDIIGFNKVSFLICIFFQIKNYKEQSIVFLQQSIENITLNEFGIIYNNLFNTIGLDFLLQIMLVKFKVSEDFYLLQKIAQICYIEKLSLKDYFTDLELLDILKILDTNKSFRALQIHLCSLLGINHIIKDALYNIKKITKKSSGTKVALCLSGQLRGYKKAWPYIKVALVDSLNADVFVHTWEDVGFKEPLLTIGHASRSFQGNILQTWLKIGETMPYEVMKSRYKSIWTLFPSSHVKQKELLDFYDAVDCIVENDQEQPFVLYSNSQKMYYKMSAVHHLMKNHGQYDYVIRLRPDKKIRKEGEINREDLFRNLETNIVCDSPLSLTPTSFFVGDQFAIGKSNNIELYVSTWDSHNKFFEMGFVTDFKLQGHKPIAERLWMSNINVISGADIKNLQIQGDLMDPQDVLSAKDIFDVLGKQLEESKYPSDVLFLKAIKQDMKVDL